MSVHRDEILLVLTFSIVSLNVWVNDTPPIDYYLIAAVVVTV